MQNVILTNSTHYSHFSNQQQTLFLWNVKGVFCLQFSTFYLTYLNMRETKRAKKYIMKNLFYLI